MIDLEATSYLSCKWPSYSNEKDLSEQTAKSRCSSSVVDTISFPLDSFPQLCLESVREAVKELKRRRM